jgi:nucleoside 2-deoxyribosyltransferase
MDIFNRLDIETVYLAGPMSGYSENNAPAFRRAAEDLRAEGFHVINPVELDDEIGSDHDSGSLSPREYAAFLGRDIVRILEEDVDALVVLKDWEKSRGVALEVHVARELEKPVFAFPSGKQLKKPSDYQPPSDENVLEEADRLTASEKHEEYGHPYDDFCRTAKIATAVLDGYLKEGVEVQPWHIPLLMIGTRMSRHVNNPKRRNFVEIAGYARTGEVVEDEMRERGEEIRPKGNERG